MSGVHVSSHPLVQTSLATLRARETAPAEFRRQVRALAILLGIEATADLATRGVEIETPLGAAACRELDGQVVIVPILRAGLGMAEGLLELIPGARVCHVGLFRDERTLKPTTYYERVAAGRPDDVAIVVDPMLATGGSAIRTCELLRAAGYSTIKVIALIAAPEGVSALGAAMPEVALFVGAMDECLTASGLSILDWVTRVTGNSGRWRGSCGALVNGLLRSDRPPHRNPLPRGARAAENAVRSFWVDGLPN